MRVFLDDLCTFSHNICVSCHDIRIHQPHVMALMALSQGGRWDSPARGQVPRLIAINSPSMQLHFYLHTPVKWACLTPYQRESKCASFPLRANKASRGIGLQGGSREGLGLLSNISIEKVLRIINYLPIVLINAGLLSACGQKCIPNADKAAAACSDFRRASSCGTKPRLKGKLQ